MFLIPSLYILEQYLLVKNIGSKCVIRKINLLFFFDVMKNEQIFASEICHFEHDDRFLFNREMGNIRSRKDVTLQKLVKFRFRLQ